MKDVVKQLREGIPKLMKAFQKLSDPRFEEQYHYIDPCPFVKFDELVKKDIKYRHVISLIVVDEIRANCPSFLPIATDSPIRIISSCYKEEPRERTIREVKDEMCSRLSLLNIVRKLRTADCTNVRLIWDINFNACSIPRDSMYGIDARSIPPEIARWSNLIWFQCPWIPLEFGRDIADLILGFLRSAADNCAPGTFVCVGITIHEDYMHRYHLEHILGDYLDRCTLNQFYYLGVDNVLIEKLLSYGYRHKGYRGIHDKLRYHHVTLVFRRNDVWIFK